MPGDNSTIPEFRAVEINALALGITREFALGAGRDTVEFALASVSFGALTILSLTSIYLLLHRGTLAQTKSRALFLSTALLYMSTGIYMAALIWNLSSRTRWIAGVTNGLFSPSYDGSADIVAFRSEIRRQSWMSTTATVINFVIGDATVWWRACVIWRHKAVYCLGPLLVTASLGVSVSALSASQVLLSDSPNVLGIVGMYIESSRASYETTSPVLLTSGNSYAYAGVLLSFATNAIATALIAYKAWEHRQLVKKQFSAIGTRSQVLQALALLVESGIMYCLLLTIIVVSEIYTAPPQASAGILFLNIAKYITHGCAVPLAAIYPTLIIVLVALRRAPIDTGGLSSLNVSVFQGYGDPRRSGWRTAASEALLPSRSTTPVQWFGREGTIEVLSTGETRRTSSTVSCKREEDTKATGSDEDEDRARHSCSTSTTPSPPPWYPLGRQQCG